MSAFTLSNRYAKSLISLAQEKGLLEPVYNDIKDLNRIFDSSRDLQLMMKSPVITPDKKLAVIRQLFEGKVNDLIFKFFVLLIKKGRESNIREILQQFIEQYNVIKGITKVKLTSAIQLDKELVNQIVISLQMKEQLKSIELQEIIDPSLIGGFVLEYDNKMIDSSVSRQLGAMRNIIEDNTYVKHYS
jgi:F-type H+-transporting ATPase subunit delta